MKTQKLVAIITVTIVASFMNASFAAFRPKIYIGMGLVGGGMATNNMVSLTENVSGGGGTIEAGVTKTFAIDPVAGNGTISTVPPSNVFPNGVSISGITANNQDTVNATIGEVSGNVTTVQSVSNGNIGGFFIVGIDGNLKITEDVAFYVAIELMQQLSGNINVTNTTVTNNIVAGTITSPGDASKTTLTGGVVTVAPPVGGLNPIYMSPSNPGGYILGVDKPVTIAQGKSASFSHTSSNFFAATDVVAKFGLSHLLFGVTVYTGGGFRAQFNVASGGALASTSVVPMVLVGGFKEFMDGNIRLIAELRAAFTSIASYVANDNPAATINLYSVNTTANLQGLVGVSYVL